MKDSQDQHDAERFYDSLAEDYHLIFPDWEGFMRHQAQVLDQLIQAHAKRTPLKLWDCTCGIGTQAIGLAERGYEVSGSDLSLKSILRARQEAQRQGLNIRFAQGDLLQASSLPEESFDLIISCDNALPHILEDTDLEKALQHVRIRLHEAGLFLGSIRDYDQLLLNRPKSTPIRKLAYEGKQVVTFQLWDWEQDQYQLQHFMLREQAEGFHTVVRQARYRAYRREEISTMLKRVGFQEITWLMPDESGYYQPVFMAF